MNTVWPLYRLAIGIVAVFALACTAPTPGSQGTASPSGQPQYGGVINLLFADDPYDFDVSYNGQSGTNSESVKLANDSLLGIKFTPGKEGNYWDNTVVPKLAERWEVSPDAKTFTFHLIKGVKWANSAPVNGRELIAADVKFSYEYLARFGPFKDMPASQQGFAFEGLAGIDTPDPYTVVVRFMDSFAPFVSWAGSGLTPIMPHEIYDRDGDFKNQVLGSNAFQLDINDSQKGSRWVFKKNPTYRDAGKPYLDAVRHLIIKDDATANAAFQTKQLDILASPGGSVADEIEKANPTAVRYDRISNGQIMWMHNKKAPTSDFRIRKAVSLALDQDAFIKTAGGGAGVWSLGAEVPLFDLFSQAEIKKITPYDPERAKQLVKEAGFPNGVDIELNFDPTAGPAVTMATLANAQLKQVGINLVLKGQPGLELNRNRQAGNFIMNLVTIRPRVDSDGVLFPSFTPGQRTNYAQVDDPKLTALVLAQRREADPVKRRDLIRQAVQYVNEGVIPFANLYAPANSVFWQPNVKNYAPHVDNRYFEHTWLEK